MIRLKCKLKEWDVTEFKGSETEQNLQKAFAEEAVDYFKYALYASLAKFEGQDYIQKCFEEVAQNEKEHAKIWFKWLNDGKFTKTLANLEDSVKSEQDAGKSHYPEFAQTARREGFEHIAGLFERVAEIEVEHEEKFKKMLQALKNENLSPDENGNYIWECSACGAVIVQKDRPDFCPLCKHDETFFYKKNPK